MNEPRVVESVTNECQSLGRAHESSSARAEQLIACLEGEIAKRDARIVELESQYQRDVFGLNNEGDPIGGDPAGGYANDNARLRAELAAIKAQEPVAWIMTERLERLASGWSSTCFGRMWADLHSHEMKNVPLYAAPVSEAKAHGVVMPEHKTPAPSSKWAAAGEPDPHGKAYDCERAELSMGEYTDDELANAVFMHDHRSFDIAATMRGEPGSIVLLTAAKERIRWLSRSLDKALALLNATHVQQVSVPDGSTKMQWPEIVALVNEVLGCEAHKYPCERGSIGHEMTGINFNSLARIIDRVRYAAPAAPAADAGLAAVEWAKDAVEWGGALNYAAWEFVNECPEKSALLFNNTKGPLRAAIIKYAEIVAARRAKGVV